MKHQEHLIDRPAYYQPCPRCSAHTLTAWAGGIRLRLDPETLNAAAELSALMSGRRTYDLMILGLPRRMYPVWRDQQRITSRKYQIVATHQCGPISRPGRPQPEQEITVPAPKPHDNNQPQF